MLAVEAHERGGPENLHVERVDRPEPPPGEVLVEVRAAGITPTELTWDTTWTTKVGTSRLPTIPSHDERLVPDDDLVSPPDDGAPEGAHLGRARFVLQIDPELVDELAGQLRVGDLVDGTDDFLSVNRS